MKLFWVCSASPSLSLFIVYSDFLIMGCASSKQKRCRHCNAPYSPVPRSYSVHVHHPPQSKDDSYHVVGLTSTTLGSLKLGLSHKVFEDGDQNGFSLLEKERKSEAWDSEKEAKEFSKGIIEEAKTWSNEIDQKIPQITPKTPTRTPPGEPETINTWELMEGLEDTSPFRSPNHLRSFSFDVHRHPFPLPHDQAISSFSKSLREISPDSPFYLGTVYNGFSFDVTEEKKSGGKERVVMYFTSLRGIRKTYEDCCHVRMILKGVGVRVDERDLSMHSGFKDELKELLGDGFSWGGLPRVFVGKKHIGGVEEIRKLHEDGQLEKLLECCEKIDDGDGVCEGCGDIRFVPCETCYGSCKIYNEGHEEEDDEDVDEVGEYGFQRCPDCNENGLIRCPICC